MDLLLESSRPIFPDHIFDAKMYRNILLSSMNIRSKVCSQLLQHINYPAKIQQYRNIKQHVYPYLLELKKRRAKAPAPVNHRNEFPEWNYKAELYSFGKRLGEEFDEAILRNALMERSYIIKQEQEASKVGLESESDLEDNRKLASQGEEIANDFIPLYLRHALPRLPEEGIQSIKNHLASEETLSLVCDGIGAEELILCADFPVEKATLANVMKALISAVNESSGLDRALLFIRDFIIIQLAETDVNDFWCIEDPIGMVYRICRNENCSQPEARIVGEAGTTTVLALYRVGLYVDKRLIGLGAGESVQIAHEMAAQDTLRRLFGTSEHQLNFPFRLLVDPTKERIPNVSANEWCEKKVAERWARK